MGSGGYKDRLQCDSVEVTSHGPCENAYYKGVNAHWMLGPDGNTYYAFTSNRQKVINCP